MDRGNKKRWRISRPGWMPFWWGTKFNKRLASKRERQRVKKGMPMSMTLEQAIRILHPDTPSNEIIGVADELEMDISTFMEDVSIDRNACLLACEVMQREVDRTKTHGKRTITLPCDYNDTLYAINRLDKTSTYIFVCEIDYIAVESSGEIVVHATFVATKYHKNPYRMVFRVSDFGQTVFTTREKAEKAAQNRSGKPLNDGKEKESENDC